MPPDTKHVPLGLSADAALELHRGSVQLLFGSRCALKVTKVQARACMREPNGCRAAQG